MVFDVQIAFSTMAVILSQAFVSLPFLVITIEAALRTYQGRALYEGALPEAALLPLCDRYGLLI